MRVSCGTPVMSAAGVVAVAAILAGCGAQASSPPAHHAKVPADSKNPVSGVCNPPPKGSVVLVKTNPDMPAPRCVAVRADQVLQIENTSHAFGMPGKTVTIRWAAFGPRSVAVGAHTRYDRSFGTYLERGDHLLHISLYGGSAGEIYLCPPPPGAHVSPQLCG